MRNSPIKTLSDECYTIITNAIFRKKFKIRKKLKKF